MDYQLILENLRQLQEEEYQKFTQKLIPNIAPEKILGVRIPKLRSLAKKIAKEDWQFFLAMENLQTFEEVMLQAMVIGELKEPLAKILPLIENFIPKIDNWSVCDSFCSGLKITRQYPKEMRQFIAPYVTSTRAYDNRFAAVMLLNYYASEDYLAENLEWLAQMKHEDYYVKMAVAWAVSIFYVKMPEEVLPFLEENSLDDFTHNKALQKITESLRVDVETKIMIRSLKRQGQKQGR